MVVKVNFDIPLIKHINLLARKNDKQFKAIQLFLPCAMFLFCVFTIFCAIKIIVISKEIADIKLSLKNNDKTAQKLSAKLSKKAESSLASYNFLIKQLPSIEIISVLQETLSMCSGISIDSVSADCYGLNLSGTFKNGSELNRFVELIGKSAPVCSVDTPVIKDTGDETHTDYTLFAKLNSLRYILTNDPLMKQETQQ